MADMAASVLARLKNKAATSRKMIQRQILRVLQNCRTYVILTHSIYRKIISIIPQIVDDVPKRWYN